MLRYEGRLDMDRNEKNEKKRIISEKIDLGSGKYKDDEVEKLYVIATEPEKCNVLTKTIKNSFTGWSSDGKFTRKEETIYSCKENDERIRFRSVYQYEDDDGQTGKHETETNNGREILNIMKSIFGK